MACRVDAHARKGLLICLKRVHFPENPPPSPWEWQEMEQFCVLGDGCKVMSWAHFCSLDRATRLAMWMGMLREAFCGIVRGFDFLTSPLSAWVGRAAVPLDVLGGGCKVMSWAHFCSLGRAGRLVGWMGMAEQAIRCLGRDVMDLTCHP